jgi:beta-aspartyl-peptidase (threonine type)
MKNALILLSIMISLTASAQMKDTSRYVLVIHGGAGTILKKNMTPERETAYKQGLQKALDAGNAILAKGGSALDAVEAAVRIMEDNPLFNAGKGAVFTNEGKNELDAAIMDGSTLKAGSIASVTRIKNPISTARKVMERSEHVMLIGQGAEKFGEANGAEMVDPSYFFTQERWHGLQKARKADSLKQAIDTTTKHKSAVRQPENRDNKYGTVGAVALDNQGNLAAATSTGGMTNKRFGRVGDAPIIGAGTYADNNTCAISGTGWGEFFIRLVMAKSVSDRMELAGQTLSDAANEMIMKKLPALGGDGGLIGVDKNGNITMPFCTEGMYRGYVKSNGETAIKIYKED